MRARGAAAAVVLAAVAALTEHPALADPSTCGGFAADAAFEVGCVAEHAHPHPGGNDEQPPRPSDPLAAYYEYRYVVMCSGNSIANDGDVMCNGAASYCAAVGEEGTAFWVYRRLVSPALPPAQRVGAWERGGIDCRGGEEPGVPTTAQVADYVRREFQRLVVVSGTTRVDPETRTLLNVDTIFSTDKAAAEALPPITLLGHRVVITVTPEEYQWQFGDGSPELRTAVPGRPLQKDVTHVYRSVGDYGASVTISWSGTFTIDGSEPLDIAGRATTTGPPTPVQVVSARSQLVRD